LCFAGAQELDATLCWAPLERKATERCQALDDALLVAHLTLQSEALHKKPSRASSVTSPPGRLAELVQRNRERGIPDDALKTKEKELIEVAGALAANRLKTNFILHRIAESEKIAVNREDVAQRIREEAARYNVTPEKMRKELEEHDRLNGLIEEILLGKTLAFLQANVSLQPGAKLTPAEAIS